MKNKIFDSVKMKNDIQARLRKRYAGMSDDKRLAVMERHLAESDSPVGKLWRDLTERHTIAKVAETPARYTAKRKG